VKIELKESLKEEQNGELLQTKPRIDDEKKKKIEPEVNNLDVVPSHINEYRIIETYVQEDLRKMRISGWRGEGSEKRRLEICLEGGQGSSRTVEP
jgi:hypothetical protein